MFEKYLENKNYSAVIGFFVVSPARAFYFGELQKRLGVRGLNEILNSLVKAGFLETFSKRGKRYYRVDQESQIYQELKNPVSKNFRSYEDELVAYLKKISGIKAAVLTGLFVGSTQAHCDLVLAGKVPEQKIPELEHGLSKLMGQEVNFAIFPVEEYQYRKNIFDRFMKDVFENEHIVLFDKTK